jgi:phenylacetate-CoA ligase
MKSIPEIEIQSPEKIKSLQEEKLKTLLQYLQLKSPFYKKLFADNHVDITKINSIEDLQQIPTTSKDNLQKNNWEFLCVSSGEIAEYSSTSGTLGKPVTIALTENDLQRLAYNECISFACADGSEEDVYQLMLTLDRQFMAGIAYYQGIRKLGASVIRVGPGLPAMQWETIERLKPTTLVAVPSFIVKLVEFAVDHKIDINKSSVKKAVCIGEGLRTPDLELNIIAKKIKDVWDIDLFSTYASTEMQTAFTECKSGKGGHHHPELLIVEVLDEKDKQVIAGVPGEVVITTLGVEGMPLLRYKTGDIAAYYTEPCACGRKTLRLGPVVGRKQQMIKLKGTTIYPQGIFEILNSSDHVRDYVVEAFTGNLGTDELKLHVFVDDNFKRVAEDYLKSIFQSRLRVVPMISFSSQPEIEKIQLSGQSRKIKKFVDTRKY